MRAQQGKKDASHALLFYIMKVFAPGNADEKCSLLSSILNPNVCTNPAAAQNELLRWKQGIRRCMELGGAPPDLTLAYRAMESIFSVIFEKAEPGLHLRYHMLKNSLGLPYQITVEAMWRVHDFAEAELGALVLSGGTSQSTGLPLTENQKGTQSAAQGQ